MQGNINKIIIVIVEFILTFTINFTEVYMPEYINRHMEEQITRMSEYYPVIMVCGPRQV